MGITCLVGLQWGDEGKGKIIDLIAKDFDFVARYQGGPNAGHTIYINGKKIVFHQIPSGILHKHIIAVLGPGMVIDLKILLDEINLIKTMFDLKGKLYISERAHIILPKHKEIDKKNSYIGTTKKGVGPCYEDKYGRRGIVMKYILQPNVLKTTLERLGSFNKNLYQELLEYGKILNQYIADTTEILHDAIEHKKRILAEGAQGSLLDIEHGTYPFVTASHTIAGGASCGLGIGPLYIEEVIGVLKAYVTRVGEGPLPTHMDETLEKRLREAGQEFGATTGRPRRLGWFDVPLARYAIKLNSATKLVLTKIDVLDSLPYIKICHSYRNSPWDESPEPLFETLQGWQTSTKGITSYKDLPHNAKKYINRLEELLNQKFYLISTGKEREQFILCD